MPSRHIKKINIPVLSAINSKSIFSFISNKKILSGEDRKSFIVLGRLIRPIKKDSSFEGILNFQFELCNFLDVSKNSNLKIKYQVKLFGGTVPVEQENEFLVSLGNELVRESIYITNTYNNTNILITVSGINIKTLTDAPNNINLVYLEKTEE